MSNKIFNPYSEFLRENKALGKEAAELDKAQAKLEAAFKFAHTKWGDVYTRRFTNESKLVAANTQMALSGPKGQRAVTSVSESSYGATAREAKAPLFQAQLQHHSTVEVSTRGKVYAGASAVSAAGLLVSLGLAVPTGGFSLIFAAAFAIASAVFGDRAYRNGFGAYLHAWKNDRTRKQVAAQQADSQAKADAKKLVAAIKAGVGVSSPVLAATTPNEVVADNKAVNDARKAEFRAEQEARNAEAQAQADAVPRLKALFAALKSYVGIGQQVAAQPVVSQPTVVQPTKEAKPLFPVFPAIPEIEVDSKAFEEDQAVRSALKAKYRSEQKARRYAADPGVYNRVKFVLGDVADYLGF